MNILWVADYGIKHNKGGAQRTNQFILDFGTGLGYNITEFNYDSDIKLLTKEYDAVISNNLEHFYHNRHPIINFLIEHKNHIRYEHDLCSYFTQAMRYDIFKSTSKVIFLGEFQHKTMEKMYGGLFDNVFYIPPYIDKTKFKNINSKREDKILYVGYLHYLKGSLNLKKYILHNPNKQFVIAGWSDKQTEHSVKSFGNVEWLGTIDHSDMPIIFNKYKTLYYHPVRQNFIDAWCRTVGEAYFCGIELDCSDNIGAIYDINKYGYDELQLRCNNSLSDFWKVIDK